jgi:hypothetical protein
MKLAVIWSLGILTALAGVLVGCKAETEERTSQYVLPNGLQDCKIYKMVGENGDSMKVMRCPNSSTTTTYETGGKSKTTHTEIIIDGVTYIPSDKEVKQ